MESTPELHKVATWLAESERVLFITGAGVSADSGLPTYRGVGGLYADADTDEGMPIEMALSGEIFRSRPELCWKYIGQIEAACRGAEPNGAHRVMARLQKRAQVLVLTQNVDGLHHVAGSNDVLDIHGNVHDLYCPACGWQQRVPDYSGLRLPPTCPTCGQVIRPDVVLFGEMLPSRKVERLMDELNRGFDLVVSVGTTSVFPYIAEPVRLQARRGRPSVEINPGKTEVSGDVSVRLQAGAAATLEALERLVEAS